MNLSLTSVALAAALLVPAPPRRAERTPRANDGATARSGTRSAEVRPVRAAVDGRSQAVLRGEVLRRLDPDPTRRRTRSANGTRRAVEPTAGSAKASRRLEDGSRAHLPVLGSLRRSDAARTRGRSARSGRPRSTVAGDTLEIVFYRGGRRLRLDAMPVEVKPRSRPRNARDTNQGSAPAPQDPVSTTTKVDQLTQACRPPGGRHARPVAAPDLPPSSIVPRQGARRGRDERSSRTRTSSSPRAASSRSCTSPSGRRCRTATRGTPEPRFAAVAYITTGSEETDDARRRLEPIDPCRPRPRRRDRLYFVSVFLSPARGGAIAVGDSLQRPSGPLHDAAVPELGTEASTRPGGRPRAGPPREGSRSSASAQEVVPRAAASSTAVSPSASTCRSGFCAHRPIGPRERGRHLHFERDVGHRFKQGEARSLRATGASIVPPARGRLADRPLPRARRARGPRRGGAHDRGRRVLHRRLIRC